MRSAFRGAAPLGTAPLAATFAAAALLAAARAHAAPLTITALDASGKPVPDAVVAVLVKGAHSVAASGTGSQIAQKDRQFVPQVLVVQTGTAVQFPNLDAVRHHVYSFSPAHKFELKLYAGKPMAPELFDKPGVAVLGCNIHDRMAAWVLVVDTPLFAKTDALGHATLDVPEGDHRLISWHAQRADPSSWDEAALHGTGAAAQKTLTFVTATSAQGDAGR